MQSLRALRTLALRTPLTTLRTAKPHPLYRTASSASSERWKARARNDPHSKAAMQQELRSRAGLKILEIDKRYKIFAPGMTVVDLGYAPGSWTQVAVDRTAPYGRVVGIDIIPAMPPRGASTIQGDFTKPAIQGAIRRFLSDPERGRPRRETVRSGEDVEGDVEEASRGYVERERMMSERKGEGEDGRDSVDVVLSDMLMNVSGIGMRDHTGSMDLCHAALEFCIDVLKPSGSFVCKFYQGPDDEMLEKKIAKVFERVYRNKPDASRLESKECYFIAIRKRKNVDKKEIMKMPTTAEAAGEPFVE